jgi:hypothetical protein
LGVGVILAVFACLPAVASVLAASDVSELLASPPSSDWLEHESSDSDLVGVITPQSYGAWVDDGGASERTLRRDGFVTGYGRAWEQKVTQNLLSEFVLEFRTASAANSWYDGFKLYDQTSKYYEKDFPALSIAHSVGVQFKFEDGSREWAVEFAKGNLVFDVTMDADTTDLTATTVAQAQTEYDMAPDMISVAATSTPFPTTSLWVVGLSLFVLSALIALVVVVLVRSGRRQAPFPAMATATGFQLSPDGASWWDGTRWRDAKVDIPPGAQRSPDGAYWWDGRTWRLKGS